MALQDLTPQLRTRLSRMERAVGWFVMLALATLLFGFGYYIYHTAERKGWFKVKASFFTFTDRATGLKVGDPVQLMGLDVGQITRMEPMPPEDKDFNIYVEFVIKEPYYGYIWTRGSRAKVATADLLGKRVIEVTKGTGGYPAYVFNPVRTFTIAEVRTLPDPQNWVFGGEFVVNDPTNRLVRALTPIADLDAIAAAGYTNIALLRTNETRKFMTAIWGDEQRHYLPYNPKGEHYWLISDETPAVTEHVERLVSEVEAALPGVLTLTNQLSAALSNASTLTVNLSELAQSARPAVSNITAATAGLDHPGALGDWLLPTNLNYQLTSTLTNANATLESANTNLAFLAANFSRSLDNLAGITSNLNSQVDANTNILTAISDTIIHADQFIQGLKHHWLFRSAFKTPRTNAPPATPAEPIRSPKERGEP